MMTEYFEIVSMLSELNKLPLFLSCFILFLFIYCAGPDFYAYLMVGYLVNLLAFIFPKDIFFLHFSSLHL